MVRGGFCRLQMPLKLALGVRETVAGHRLGALEGGGGGLTTDIGRRGGWPGDRTPSGPAGPLRSYVKW